MEVSHVLMFFAMISGVVFFILAAGYLLGTLLGNCLFGPPPPE